MSRFMAFAVILGIVIAPSFGCGKKADKPGAGTSENPSESPKVVNVGVTQIQPVVPDQSTLPGNTETNGNTLPSGAVLRLGSEIGKPAKGWGSATLLPDGKRLLAPHNRLQPHMQISLYYSLYDVNGLTPIGPSIPAEVSSGDEFRGAAAVSADGRRIVSMNVTAINVLDTATGKRVRGIPRSLNAENSASLSGDGKLLAVGSRDNTVPAKSALTCAIWDVDAGKEIGRVNVIQNGSCTGLLSPDGKTLITSGSHHDNKLYGNPNNPAKLSQIWDVASKTEVAKMPWPQEMFKQFSPDSSVIAVWNYGRGPVLLVDPRTGKTLQTLDAGAGGPGAAAFTADSKVFAMVNKKETIRWDVASGRPIGTTPRPDSVPAGVNAYQAAFDGPDRLIAFGSQALSAYLWDALGGTLLTPAGGGHSGQVRIVAYTADGKEVVSVAADGVAIRWDAASGAELGRTELRPSGTSGDIGLSADGRRAFLDLTTIALPEGTKVAAFREALAPDGFVMGQFPSSDGAYVSVFGPHNSDKPVRCVVIETTNGKKLGEASLPAGLIRASAAISPDRKRFYTAVSTKLVNNKTDVLVAAWDVASSRKLGEATLPDAGGVCGLATLGERQVVVATGQGRLAVINPEAGSVRDIPDATRLACEALTASPDGKLVAVCQTGRTPASPYLRAIRVYDVSTGEVRHTVPVLSSSGNTGVLSDSLALINRTSPPEVMAFSPDGTRLATPAKTSVLIWDLAKLDKNGKTK